MTKAEKEKLKQIHQKLKKCEKIFKITYGDVIHFEAVQNMIIELNKLGKMYDT